MKFEPDEWLSRVFGYAVFKVTLADQNKDGSSERMSETLREITNSAAAFYYARIPTTRIDQVQVLTQRGFNVVDVNINFERKPASEFANATQDGAVVRKYSPSDRDAVLEIASSCFTYSRFHLDSQITKGTADAVKRAWVESYCQQSRGERLLVAEADGRVTGFLAVLGLSSVDGKKEVIDLIGVDKSHQGRGVGRKLVDHFINDSAGRDIVLTVGTQVANIPSIRLYERCGFRTTGASYVLHAHVREHELVR